ncbi:MAG TPA: hypothetical protein VNV38_22765 [Stellaceae bacterium]|jgi:hypothetical protein|nr:hypothetical protein [Stellaceae bacterium]
MLKSSLAAAFLAFTLAAPALAQSASATSPSSPVVAQPVSDPSVDACVAQMHKMAQMSKGLGANYNADRVRRDCAAGVYSH